MGNLMAQLPEKIQKHLEGLIEGAGLPKNEQSGDLLAENWIAKKEMFDSMLQNLSLQETDTLAVEDGRAALLLTYSGSLIGLGPARENGRSFEYASIKLRGNVPGIVSAENSLVKEAIRIDSSASFGEAPIRSTSALYKIAVCAPGVETAEQEKRIKEAMIYLTNGFVKLNRKCFTAPGEAPEQFTLQAMVKFIAGKHRMTQKQAKAVVLDFLTLVETGVLLGERVGMGRLGRLSLKLRRPRKPRVLKSRFTGREITIPAKPERYGPRMSFSKNLKVRAAGIPPEK